MLGDDYVASVDEDLEEMVRRMSEEFDKVRQDINLSVKVAETEASATTVAAAANAAAALKATAAADTAAVSAAVAVGAAVSVVAAAAARHRIPTESIARGDTVTLEETTAAMAVAEESVKKMVL